MTTNARRSPVVTEGWPLVGWAGIVVAAIVAAALAFGSAPGEGLRSGIRATATSSLALFLLAFVASSLHALRPSAGAKWLLRNRRYVGVGFATSHAAHLGLILGLVARDAADFSARVSSTTVIGGGIGYVFIAAMTATSFDRTARWLGRRLWRILHTTGMYLLWGIFFFSYVGRIPSPRYTTFTALLVAALALRIAARLRPAQRRGHTGPGSGVVGGPANGPATRSGTTRAPPCPSSAEA
jgi:sulfoxide reductase heme-binding subunit YedZ